MEWNGWRAGQNSWDSYIHVKSDPPANAKSQCADFILTEHHGRRFLILIVSYCSIQRNNLPATRKAFDENTESIYAPSQANSNKPGDKWVSQVFNSWMLKIRNHIPKAQNWRSLTVQTTAPNYTSLQLTFPRSIGEFPAWTTHRAKL